MSERKIACFHGYESVNSVLKNSEKQWKMGKNGHVNSVLRGLCHVNSVLCHVNSEWVVPLGGIGLIFGDRGRKNQMDFEKPVVS